MILLITFATMFGFVPCIEMIFMELILILHTTMHSTFIKSFTVQTNWSGKGEGSHALSLNILKREEYFLSIFSPVLIMDGPWPIQNIAPHGTAKTTMIV